MQIAHPVPGGGYQGYIFAQVGARVRVSPACLASAVSRGLAGNRGLVSCLDGNATSHGGLYRAESRSGVRTLPATSYQNRE